VRAREPAFEPEIGAVVADKYRLERLLKSGGMGTVWVAHHLTLDTAVAIKFMSMPEDDERGVSSSGVGSDDGAISRARFEREARAAAQIRSANVVQILDYGVDRGAAYIVMELLDGHDLELRLRRGRRLTLQEAAKIVTPVLHLLQRAHDAGMVHRDLKPANIFLAKDGDAEVPKVLDFGVAKSSERTTTEGDLTADRTLIGTPHYASPEQLKNSAKIDHRADLWSMGVVLFRMVTGKKPFRSSEMIEAIVEVCSATVPSATSVAPDLPKEVDAFFARALERDLERRFQSAREMAQALNALVTTVADRPAASALEVLDSPGSKDEGKDTSTASRKREPSSPSLPSQETPAPQLPPEASVDRSIVAPPRRPGWLIPAAIAATLGVLAGVVLTLLRSPPAPVHDGGASQPPATGVASPTPPAAPGPPAATATLATAPTGVAAGEAITTGETPKPPPAATAVAPSTAPPGASLPKPPGHPSATPKTKGKTGGGKEEKDVGY
jgi:serine/threonine-protein kinase